MALKSLSTDELQRELARRAKDAGKLENRRTKLLAELAEVEKELSFLGGALGAGPAPRAKGSPTGRKRAKNDMSLPDAIAQAMEVRAIVSPKEAADLVRANGFTTTSKNFNMMVSNALAKDKRFKRLGRGQYERIA